MDHHGVLRRHGQASTQIPQQRARVDLRIGEASDHSGAKWGRAATCRPAIVNRGKPFAAQGGRVDKAVQRQGRVAVGWRLIVQQHQPGPRRGSEHGIGQLPADNPLGHDIGVARQVGGSRQQEYASIECHGIAADIGDGDAVRCLGDGIREAGNRGAHLRIGEIAELRHLEVSALQRRRDGIGGTAACLPRRQSRIDGVADHQREAAWFSMHTRADCHTAQCGDAG